MGERDRGGTVGCASPPRAANCWNPPQRGRRANGDSFVFLELFAGMAGLTKAVAEICTKVIALGAEDKRFGEDLTNDNSFVKMFDLAKAENVTWIHMAPPCRTFTRARRSDHHGTAKRLRSEGKPQGWGDPKDALPLQSSSAS